MRGAGTQLRVVINLTKESVMHWNHRVVDRTADNEGDPLFQIREVYYEGNGMPSGHCEPTLVSETMEGLAEIVDRMREALAQPVLTPEDFKENEDGSI